MFECPTPRHRAHLSQKWCTCCRHSENQRWPWWRDINGELRELMPIPDRMRSFFPLTRYTPAMLMLLEEHLGRSSGFCEVYVPSLAVYYGLTAAPLPDGMEGPMSASVIKKVELHNDNRVHHKYSAENQLFLKFRSPHNATSP